MGDINRGSTPIRKLPDPDICRAQHTDGPGLVFCLVTTPYDCKHAGFLDEVAYCLHPKREEIIARTKPPN
jgi:hypothetical protein